LSPKDLKPVDTAPIRGTFTLVPEVADMLARSSPDTMQLATESPRYLKAFADGDPDDTAVWFGEAAGLIDAVETRRARSSNASPPKRRGCGNRRTSRPSGQRQREPQRGHRHG